MARSEPSNGSEALVFVQKKKRKRGAEGGVLLVTLAIEYHS